MNESDIIRQNLLIEILLDPNAEAGEKDDAAMDLAHYNSKETLNALIQAAITAEKNEFFLDVCGESIGELWIKNNEFKLNIYSSLPLRSQKGVFYTLEELKPEWIKKFNLEDPYKGISKKNLRKGNF